MEEKRSYTIDGETVSWANIGNGKEGWHCTCWKKTLPNAGAYPSCKHSRYVELELFYKRPVKESGELVSLDARRRTRQEASR